MSEQRIKKTERRLDQIEERQGKLDRRADQVDSIIEKLQKPTRPDRDPIAGGATVSRMPERLDSNITTGHFDS